VRPLKRDSGPLKGALGKQETKNPQEAHQDRYPASKSQGGRKKRGTTVDVSADRGRWLKNKDKTEPLGKRGKKER